jgi:hypothetical protein
LYRVFVVLRASDLPLRLLKASSEEILEELLKKGEWKHARDFVAQSGDTQLLDSITQRQLTALLEHHRASGGLWSMMVRASGDETVRGLFYACVAAALVLFVVNACLLTVRGQTLGKLIVGIRIVDPNTDANAGFARTVLLRSGVPMFLNSLSAGIFGLIDVLFIFREDRRCLHDLMANTKVVGRQPAIDPAAFE